MTSYLITKRSKNKKVGPMMVTTSERSTCPSACPFKDNGCYADGGPLRFLWDKLSTSDGKPFKNGKGTVTPHTHRDLVSAISDLPAGSTWRHNQAGDLPGDGDNIDTSALLDIVFANEGRNGFTYTHKPVLEHKYDGMEGLKGNYVQVTENTVHRYVADGNRKSIASANARGFTINLSANNLTHADELADLQIGPVVTVLPIDQMTNTETPAGRQVVICPVVTGKTESCMTCKLCAKVDRKTIVGFPAHGAGKNKANSVTTEGK